MGVVHQVQRRVELTAGHVVIAPVRAFDDLRAAEAFRDLKVGELKALAAATIVVETPAGPRGIGNGLAVLGEQGILSIDYGIEELKVEGLVVAPQAPKIILPH